MEQIAESVANLFADTLPSLEEIQAISEYTNSSQSQRNSFAQKLEAEKAGLTPKTSASVGIGLYILGRNQEAVDTLNKASDCKEKYIYLAYALDRLKQYDKAIQALQKSLEYKAEVMSITLEKAATYRRSGDFAKAQEVLNGLKNFENVSAEYHYQLGRLEEVTGLYDKAIQDYTKAIELAPNHRKALFHLAYRCDLLGDEEAAIDYYNQISASGYSYISSMLNLAVLYEDQEKFELAYKCIDMVLEAYPNHPRARLFLKDIESSKTMFYDEEKEKKKNYKSQILDTPISDFELSVRSRNCLKKMKIETLGDLLNITEAELLSYKNFGETSLKEVKAILESKGLHLGMTMEDKQFTMEEHHTVAAHNGQEQEILNKPIDDLMLSVRARKAIQKLNIHTIGELTIKTEAELLCCKNFGMTSLNEIKKTLGDLGLSLRTLD